MSEGEAWRKYLELLRPLAPDAYERFEPYAWRLLQERLAKIPVKA